MLMTQLHVWLHIYCLTGVLLSIQNVYTCQISSILVTLYEKMLKLSMNPSRKVTCLPKMHSSGELTSSYLTNNN